MEGRGSERTDLRLRPRVGERDDRGDEDGCVESIRVIGSTGGYDPG